METGQIVSSTNFSSDMFTDAKKSILVPTVLKTLLVAVAWSSHTHVTPYQCQCYIIALYSSKKILYKNRRGGKGLTWLFSAYAFFSHLSTLMAALSLSIVLTITRFNKLNFLLQNVKYENETFKVCRFAVFGKVGGLDVGCIKWET